MIVIVMRCIEFDGLAMRRMTVGICPGSFTLVERVALGQTLGGYQTL